MFSIFTLVSVNSKRIAMLFKAHFNGFYIIKKVQKTFNFNNIFLKKQELFQIHYLFLFFQVQFLSFGLC